MHSEEQLKLQRDMKLSSDRRGRLVDRPKLTLQFGKYPTKASRSKGSHHYGIQSPFCKPQASVIDAEDEALVLLPVIDLIESGNH